MICEISQIVSSSPVWNTRGMSKHSVPPGVSAKLVDLLEAVRPLDPAKGKPLSDGKWCDAAQVSRGFWRDLRGGTDPSVDRVERMARAAGLKLSELLEGAEAPIDPLPSADELAAMVEAVQRELMPGTTLGDYPQFVGPALLARLRQYGAARRATPVDEKVTALDKVAPPRRSTKPGAPAK